MIFASRLSDIFEKFTQSEVLIVADENYGACCIEDQAAYLYKIDFLIHYGHSCLVPISQTLVKTIYVFVDILIDVDHLVQTILFNFPEKNTFFYLMGVVQFNKALFVLREMLNSQGYSNLEIP